MARSSNAQSMTYAHVGSVLSGLGMVLEEKVRSVLDDFADCAYEESDPYGAARALESFGAAPTSRPATPSPRPPWGG
ncbi:hypothetical protein ABT168_35105 [Streptomyces sp. NPDC001793]|uniref:hypothetical protein n=1 Tax=Streptomyces sp. NPDC001793 TaxID=3154657 RepID=UPI003318EDE0